VHLEPGREDTGAHVVPPSKDIGDPGFMTDFGFPQTKEINKNIEAGIGFRDNGGRYYHAQPGVWYSLGQCNSFRSVA